MVQLESGERDSKNYFLTYSTLKQHSGSTVVMKDTLDNARDVSKGYTWRINQVASHISLAKNFGGRVGVKENFKGGRGQKNLKILPQICDNPERSRKFSKKGHFIAKKVKNFFKNANGGG